MPPIRFFLADTNHPINSDHPLWNQPLPDRNGSEFPERTDTGSPPLTYGGYFSAVCDFCTANGWGPIQHACRQTLQRSVTENDISRLDIFLKKHGALYHPGRLSVTVQDQTLFFVINVAGSADGCRTLTVEMDALKRLGEHRPFDWLPSVYGGTVDPVPMFLADWFDGYHEFHLTRRERNKTLSVMVWDGADSPTLLSEKLTSDLYAQAAMILTACYNPITTEQIFPWHHAAGDFVIRVAGNTLDVKLITVRNYAPVLLLEKAPANERQLLDRLVVFFIHLSLQMRLDRLDGVSEIVWAPDACIAPMVEGFFNGLDLTGRLTGFPDSFPTLFQDYFNHQHPAQLMDLATSLLSAVFDARKEETRIVERHLALHVDQIGRCIATRKNRSKTASGGM